MLPVKQLKTQVLMEFRGHGVVMTDTCQIYLTHFLSGSYMILHILYFTNKGEEPQLLHLLVNFSGISGLFNVFISLFVLEVLVVFAWIFILMGIPALAFRTLSWGTQHSGAATCGI